jgi:3-phosphoshikimate 1-carboxyvinyltransferase
MSFAVAAQVARGPVMIRDCANVDTSFPGFLSLVQACGFRVGRA